MPMLRKLTRVAALAAASWSFAAAAQPSFVPVFTDNFPDPHVILHNGEFIAYSTNDRPNLPMLRSKDLVHWSRVTDASGKPIDGMPRLGAWAKTGFTWAPEVMKVGNQWLLYYTAAHRSRNVQCIGVAAAASPTGPFVDTSSRPMVCQFDIGGTIDASPFRDADGKLYLYYKNDGNRVRQDTMLWGHEMSPDGLTVIGQPAALAKNDKKWEMNLVEAPFMVRAPRGYQLFYSAAFFGWSETQRLSNYATGYAQCAGPLGPCTDAPENPISTASRTARRAASAALVIPRSSRPDSATSSRSTPGRRPAAAGKTGTSATSTLRPYSGRMGSRRSGRASARTGRLRGEPNPLQRADGSDRSGSRAERGASKAPEKK